MRTAMQLMVWYLENEGLEESGAYYKAKMLLEKEKEQILKAYEDGADYGMDVIEDGLDYVVAIEYYNQKYNQNK